MAKAKNRHKQHVDENPIEAVKRVSSGVAQSVKDDVLKGMTSDMFKQFLGLAPSEQKNSQNNHGENQGDLAEGEELVLSEVKKKEAKKEIEAGEVATEYIRGVVHGKDRATQEQNQEISTKLSQITAELKRLISASKELQVAYKEVAVEQKVIKPGKYHESFFEWLLSTVRVARMKVENSAAWLNAFKGKKAKKDYWSQFKKQGTTFGLSNERVVATQVG